MSFPTDYHINDVIRQLGAYFAENNKLPVIRSLVPVTNTLLNISNPGITQGTVFDLSPYTFNCFFVIVDGSVAGTTMVSLELAESAGATGSWITMVTPTIPGLTGGVRRVRSNQNNINGYVRASVDKAGSTASVMVVAISS